MYLRQHTATQVQIGPYLSATDGNTELATLIFTASSVFFSKVGGVLALGTSTATMAGGTLGWYTLALASSNVDTVGRFRIYNHATFGLPVWHDLTVLPQQVYDSWITATDNLQIDILQINGNTVTATGTLFPADVIQWVHQNVTSATSGNPQVDIRLLNGATFTTFDVNVTKWTGQTVATATGTLPDVNAQQVAKATPQTATDIAAAVWNKTASDHTIQGSFGNTIGSQGTNPNTIWQLANDNLDEPTSQVVTDVMGAVVEGTVTVVQSLRGMNSANMGNVVKNTTTGDVAIRDIADSKNRIQAGTSASGRTVTNRDLT